MSRIALTRILITFDLVKAAIIAFVDTKKPNDYY